MYRLTLITLYLTVFVFLVVWFRPSLNNIGYLISLVILFVGLIWIKWKLPYLLGKAGEKFVNKKLEPELDPRHYRLLYNLFFSNFYFINLLPSNTRLETTQIDHVVVSNYGIFVLETKNYKGWIFGDAYDDYWTQVNFRFKSRFCNPLHQNFVHVKTIESLIRPEFPNVLIKSFVIFPRADKLNISQTGAVSNATGIIEKIKSYYSPILSDEQRDRIYEILDRANIKDKAVRKEHIKKIKEMLS